MVKINRMASGGASASASGITLSSLDDDFAFPSTTDTPTVTWSYAAASGVVPTRFEVAIGTTAGGSDVLPWTSAGTATTFSQSGLALTVGSTYYASVRAVYSGGTSAVLQGDGWKVVTPVSVAARYSAGPDWNNYVRTASTTTACDGTELDYFYCIHGGEKRRVNYTAATNCSGYTIADELGAFEWSCDATGGAGNVFFHSTGLKKSKALANLVTSTAWKDNRVVISQGGVPVAASARGKWWNNTVSALPTSPTAGTKVNLSGAGTIYVAPASMSAVGGYNLSSNGVALVIPPGLTLSLSSSATANCAGSTCLVYAASTLFNWIEGAFAGNGAGTQNGIILASTQQGVIRRATFTGFSDGFGKSGQVSHTTMISQVNASKNTNGIVFGGSGSYAQDISAHSNVSTGLSLYFAGAGSAQNIYTSHNSRGIYVFASNVYNVVGVTALDDAAQAVFSSNSSDNTFHVVLGPGVIAAANANRQTFSQSGTEAMNLSTVTTGKVTGNWVKATGGFPCTVTGGTNPGLVNTTCVNQGSSDSVQVAANGVSAYLGSITSDDLSNTSDNNGAMAFSSITDWVNFDAIYRTWNGAGAVPGVCNTGICTIWDYRFASSDTRYQNTTYDGTNQNPVFNQQGGNCPAFLNTALTDVQSPSHTYLANAMEILGSGGNNNGLCEAGETCLYTPNFGAYQGEGDYTKKWCSSTGAVAGATVYAY